MILYSVIIPTFNRSASLKKTLYSVIKQTIRANTFEIIIVDDGSTDDTLNIVKKFQQRNKKITVHYLYQSNKGAAIARNTGIKIAKGKIIFFTDDDCRVPKNWMETFLTVFKNNKKIVGVAGWYSPPRKNLENNIYNWFIYLSHRFFYGNYLDFFEGTNIQLKKEKVIEENFPICNGGNIAYKKSILQKIGGFNTKLVFGFDDYELSQRIRRAGNSMYYYPLHVIHDKKFTLLSFLRYMFTHAKAKKIFLKEYPFVVKRDAEIQMPFTLFIRFKQFYDVYILLSHAKNIPYIRILFCAFLWFYVHSWVYYLPVSLKKR